MLRNCSGGKIGRKGVRTRLVACRRMGPVVPNLSKKYGFGYLEKQTSYGQRQHASEHLERWLTGYLQTRCTACQKPTTRISHPGHQFPQTGRTSLYCHPVSHWKQRDKPPEVRQEERIQWRLSCWRLCEKSEAEQCPSFMVPNDFLYKSAWVMCRLPGQILAVCFV